MDTLPVFLCSLAHRLWASAVGAGCIYATGRFRLLHYDAEHDDYYAGGNLHDHYDGDRIDNHDHQDYRRNHYFYDGGSCNDDRHDIYS